MKIINKESGKEVKGTVVYSNMSGDPVKVVVDGSVYAAKHFDLVDEKDTKRTKPATRKTVKKTPSDDGIMTTKNTGARKK